MPEYWQAHLTFALLGFLLVPGFSLSPIGRGGQLLLLFAAGFIVVDGLPLAEFVRTVTDDVAITTLVALSCAALVKLNILDNIGSNHRWQLLLLFTVLAIFLYPPTLGLTHFDTYRLGYHPRPLLLAAGLLALLLLLARNWPGVFMLGLATLAFALSVKPSENYWDYLLDPFIALYCWGSVLWACSKRAYGACKALVPVRP